MIHSITCAGVLPTQYTKNSNLVGMGHVGYHYMDKGTYLPILVSW